MGNILNGREAAERGNFRRWLEGIVKSDPGSSVGGVRREKDGVGSWRNEQSTSEFRGELGSIWRMRVVEEERLKSDLWEEGEQFGRALQCGEYRVR